MEKIFNHLKVSLLENDIIRFEYSPNDHFTEQESLFVAHKNVSGDELEINGGDVLSFEFKGFKFTFERNNPLNTLVVNKGDKQVINIVTLKTLENYLFQIRPQKFFHY